MVTNTSTWLRGQGFGAPTTVVAATYALQQMVLCDRDGVTLTDDDDDGGKVDSFISKKENVVRVKQAREVTPIKTHIIFVIKRLTTSCPYSHD